MFCNESEGFSFETYRKHSAELRELTLWKGSLWHLENIGACLFNKSSKRLFLEALEIIRVNRKHLWKEVAIEGFSSKEFS